MRYPLPYAFARNQQVLLEDSGDTLTLFLHLSSPASGISEVMRRYPAHRVELQAAAALQQRISAAYAQGESSAASVVSEVESDADLSRMGAGGKRACKLRFSEGKTPTEKPTDCRPNDNLASMIAE